MSRKRVFIGSLLSSFALQFSPKTVAATHEAPTEYDVKAAYLFNFAKFVNWPDSGTANGFTIGILGDDPFGAGLEGMLAGKTVQDKPLVVRHLHSVEEALACQVVFVGADQVSNVRALVNALAHKPVLTVADAPGFVDNGGIVGFQQIHQNVRFNINLHAAEEAHLKISSELLKVANSVRGAPSTDNQ